MVGRELTEVVQVVVDLLPRLLVALELGGGKPGGGRASLLAPAGGAAAGGVKTIADETVGEMFVRKGLELITLLIAVKAKVNIFFVKTLIFNSSLSLIFIDRCVGSYYCVVFRWRVWCTPHSLPACHAHAAARPDESLPGLRAGLAAREGRSAPLRGSAASLLHTAALCRCTTDEGT